MAGTKDLIRVSDWDRQTAERVFSTAQALKAEVKEGHFRKDLAGINAALIFQKPSLRTRVTFDIGINQLGGHAVYLGPGEISMGVRESVYDVARNLERWVNLVVARVFSQDHVAELAAVAAPPVINALSDEEHPCQVYADFLTLKEKGLAWSDIHLAYIGDGNNVCASLMFLGAILGIDFRIGCPEKYCLPSALIDQARAFADKSGGQISVTSVPEEAVKGANAVYTDIWASMGWENEAAERAQAFRSFQVNKALISHAEPDALVMHDLPAHRGEEITDEMMDSPNSIVFDQAENRLHAQKAIMMECLARSL